MDAWEGGGAIVDNGPNAFDVLRHLFGEVSVSKVDVQRSSRGVDMRSEILGSVGDGRTAGIFGWSWAYDGEVKDLLLYRRDGTISRYDVSVHRPSSHRFAMSTTVSWRSSAALLRVASPIRSDTPAPPGSRTS